MDDKLVIPPTGTDPEVDLNALSGKLFIRGKSISENPENFFSPVYDWMETHLPAFPDEINFTVYLTSCRPQTLLEIARLLRLLDKNIMQKKVINVVWQYQKDDEEMKEAGELIDRMIKKDLQYESV